MDAGGFQAGNTQYALEFLRQFDAVFDVLRPSEKEDSLSNAQVDEKIAERTHAKKARDFKRADAIRQELDAQGIILEDTKDGVRWKRK